jgi:hypothetical protein
VAEIFRVRKWVEKGEKPELKEITEESITVKSMWAQFYQLTIIDDVLVRRLEGSIAMRSIGNPVSTICIGALFFSFGGFFCEQNEQPAT